MVALVSESGGLPYVVVYDAQVCASACSRSRDCKLSICGRVMLIAACASREASVTALGDPVAWAVAGSRSCCPQVLVPVHDAVIQHVVIVVCLLDAPPPVFVTGSQAVSASVVDRVVWVDELTVTELFHGWAGFYWVSCPVDRLGRPVSCDYEHGSHDLIASLTRWGMIPGFRS